MTNPYSATQWLQLSMQQQGLLKPLGSLSELLQQLSYVQIDSINVVERAHHHVLHSRLPHYATSMLDEAMGDKTVFEYLSHAAAYLPLLMILPNIVKAQNHHNIYIVHIFNNYNTI